MGDVDGAHVCVAGAGRFAVFGVGRFDRRCHVVRVCVGGVGFDVLPRG